MEEVFQWLDENFDGEEDIADVANRVRITGILKAVA